MPTLSTLDSDLKEALAAHRADYLKVVARVERAEDEAAKMRMISEVHAANKRMQSQDEGSAMDYRAAVNKVYGACQ